MTIAELYVCDNCGSVELELHNGSSCENCDVGELVCTDFIPASRLSDLQAVASKLAFALRGHDALPDDNEALSAYEKLMEQK